MMKQVTGFEFKLLKLNKMYYVEHGFQFWSLFNRFATDQNRLEGVSKWAD